MRLWTGLLATACVGLALVGCSAKKSFDGPTVDAFNGRLTHDGKPVHFSDERVILQVFHQTGTSFGIPIQEDGSFQIGWMPIGKYSAVLMRDPKGAKGAPGRYNVPGGLTIEDGKTEYTIELGKGFKP